MFVPVNELPFFCTKVFHSSFFKFFALMLGMIPSVLAMDMYGDWQNAGFTMVLFSCDGG